MSPQEQSKCAGAKPKTTKKKKKPAADDDEEEASASGDDDACSSGGTGYRGRGRGRGRGRAGRGAKGRGKGRGHKSSSPRPAATKRKGGPSDGDEAAGPEQDEPSSPQTKKTKKGSGKGGKGGASAKAKAKARANPKAAAKGSPTAKAKGKAATTAKREESPVEPGSTTEADRASKCGEKRKVESKAKAKAKKAPKGKGDTEERSDKKAEQMARASRKSSAYHKTKTAALKAGKTPEEAAEEAKKVLLQCPGLRIMLGDWKVGEFGPIFEATPLMVLLILVLLAKFCRHIDKQGKACFTGKQKELKESGIPDSWLDVMDSFVAEAAKARIAALQSQLNRPASKEEPPSIPGAPYTSLQSTAKDESIPGDVAGKNAVALGSFKASSQDAQQDPLMWADSQATLRMGSFAGVVPKPAIATPTKNLIRMESPPAKKGKGHGTPSIKAPANPELGLFEKLKHHSPSKSGSKKRHREQQALSPVAPTAATSTLSSDDASPEKSGKKEALEMYRTDDGREKLRSLLKQHGDFGSLEIAVSKWNKRISCVLNRCNDKVLETSFICAKLRAMCDHGFAWAKSRGLVRHSEIHGEEEGRFVLSDDFMLCDETGQEINMSGSFEAEDCPGVMYHDIHDDSGFLLEATVPSMSASAGDLIGATGVTATDGNATVATNASTASFKIIFPTLCHNASATSILASFIEVLGRKVDSCEDLMETLEGLKNNRATSLKDQLSVLLATMKKNYKLLTEKQSDSLNGACDKSMMKRGPSSCVGGAKAKAKTSRSDSDEDSSVDDDLAAALFYGFAEGADSAKHVIDLATIADKKLRRHGVVDVQLSELAKCGQGGRNHSRNLHRLIHRTGRTLPVTVTTVPTPIRILKGKPKVHTCNYPTMMLSSWAKQLFSTGGQFLLSGYTIDDVKYRGLFKDFWTQYQQVEPELDFYSRDFEWETAIPFSFHGDEGRGKLKRPIMIEAYQPLITHRGPEFTNSHSFTTRLLFAVVPSEYYASRTLEVLHRALVDDWLKLYEEGLTVSWDVLCNSELLLVRARGFVGRDP
ncbi:unnamed protein product [Symbiodinium sp. CCMP2592]|nr:unnamed protein product [Symbiodinium sp. CCMP2592]